MAAVTRREVNRHLAEIARRDLYSFVRIAWRFVEPGRPFVPNWHIRKLCRKLMRVTAGEIRKLIINVPPSTMKSLLVSVFWPAWEWASDPRRRYLCGAYGAHLSIRDNLRLRMIVDSPWYREFFWNRQLAEKFDVDRLRLSGDQNQKMRFDTTATGWRIATSVHGPGTGEHPDVVIVDDPLSEAQSRSEKDRESAWNWISRTLSTRGVARKAAFVLIMQRLHQQDPAGRLLELGGYHHVCLPMYYEPGRDPSGIEQRTEPGALLWPKLLTREICEDLALILAEYGVAGQFQQRPAPAGGGLFKSAWFEIVDAVPSGGVECRGWDTAATADGGDWTAGVKMKKVGPLFIVTHVKRGQWSPADVDKNMAATAVMDGKSCRVREEQEPGASGKIVIADRVRTLVGYDYKGVPAQVDKLTRARPYRAQCEAGNVKLLRGEWNQAYLDELANFPTGSHDDQVDGSSTAFNELALGPMQMRTRKTVWG